MELTVGVAVAYERLRSSERGRRVGAGLVGTGGGLGGEDAAQLVKHPVLGGIEPLEVLLGSARHCEGLGEGFIEVSVVSSVDLRGRVAHPRGDPRRGILKP